MAGVPGNYSPRLTKIPPDKGSFPIDREAECQKPMLNFLKCLRENKYDNESCRHLIKDYLQCRMDNGLMAKDEWKNLLGKSSSEHISAKS